MKRSLTCGVGINDANYGTRRYAYVEGKKKQQVVWTCPYYAVWRGVLYRCYLKSFQKRNPSYVGCTIFEEWKYFTKFKAWMEAQAWEGKELDKDILFPGNKVYGPETCMFVPKSVNQFFNRHGSDLYSVGTSFRKDCGMYVAYCSQLDGTMKHLGYFDTQQKANSAWLVEKKRLAEILAESQEDIRLSNAILSYYDKALAA